MLITMDKQNNQDDNKNLNYMRNEVQKIIDNHLKDDNRQFSVMDWNQNQITILIKLITWKIKREDLEKEYKSDRQKLNMTYDQIMCEHDYLTSIKNIYNDTKSDLNSLDSDLELEKQLN